MTSTRNDAAADMRQAFVDSLERHRGIVRKIAHSYAWQADDREELAQEITAQLWRAWPDYDPARRLSTWLYRIALNVAISHVRSHARRDRHMVALDESTLDTHPHTPADDAGGDQETADRLRLLHRFIAAQPPLDRALLLLYLEARSTREIAEVLGIGESNVTTRISRLKQRLRAYVATDDRPAA